MKTAKFIVGEILKSLDDIERTGTVEEQELHRSLIKKFIKNLEEEIDSEERNI
jgi:hypothetical protein